MLAVLSQKNIQAGQGNLIRLFCCRRPGDGGDGFGAKMKPGQASTRPGFFVPVAALVRPAG